MNAAFRLVAGIWRGIVEASTSRLNHSASAPDQFPKAPTLPPAGPAPRLLSRADYQSLAKQAELRPALTGGIVAEVIIHFTLLFVLAWRFLRYTPDMAAVLAAGYMLAAAAGLAIASSRGELSLALSDNCLVGPAAIFFGRRLVSVPLYQLSLAPLESTSLWMGLITGVRLGNPAGVRLRFIPHRYRRRELEAFFRVVAHAQATAT